MILKASIVGMLVVLVIVVYLSYKQDGFVGQMAANQASNPAAPAAPAAPQATPQRNDIRPQVSLSDTSQQAMHMKQQSDFLKDLQTVIRNELRLARATDSSAVASTSLPTTGCPPRRWT